MDHLKDLVLCKELGTPLKVLELVGTHSYKFSLKIDGSACVVVRHDSAGCSVSDKHRAKRGLFYSTDQGLDESPIPEKLMNSLKHVLKYANELPIGTWFGDLLYTPEEPPMVHELGSYKVRPNIIQYLYASEKPIGIAFHGTGAQYLLSTNNIFIPRLEVVPHWRPSLPTLRLLSDVLNKISSHAAYTYMSADHYPYLKSYANHRTKNPSYSGTYEDWLDMRKSIVVSKSGATAHIKNRIVDDYDCYRADARRWHDYVDDIFYARALISDTIETIVENVLSTDLKPYNDSHEGLVFQDNSNSVAYKLVCNNMQRRLLNRSFL